MPRRPCGKDASAEPATTYLPRILTNITASAAIVTMIEETLISVRYDDSVIVPFFFMELAPMMTTSSTERRMRGAMNMNCGVGFHEGAEWKGGLRSDYA